MSIELVTIVCAVGGVVLAVLGWLLQRLLKVHEDRVEELSKTIVELQDKVTLLEKGKADRKVEEHLVAVDKDKVTRLEFANEAAGCVRCRDGFNAALREIHQRINAEIKDRILREETLQKEIGDLGITLAGVGSIYATRDELTQLLVPITSSISYNRNLLEGRRDKQ